MIFFWTSSQPSFQFWDGKSLYWWEFLKFGKIVYCVCFNIEPCLLPANQVCSIAIISSDLQNWWDIHWSNPFLDSHFRFSTVYHYLYV